MEGPPICPVVGISLDKVNGSTIHLRWFWYLGTGTVLDCLALLKYLRAAGNIFNKVAEA